MQRLHPDDLSGHLIKNDTEKWHVLKLPAIKEDGTALWTFKHTLEELNNIRNLNPVNFDRQYNQNPRPREGLLYGKFKTYSELPKHNQVYNYTDTADTGNDYLCSIDYIEHNNLIYILEVLYTDKPNEYTEPKLAQQFKTNGVNISNIESNNGGRAFARNVERLTRKLGNNKTSIKWFHQSKNKEARIRSNSSTVNNLIVMPDNWHIRWPEFYDDVTNYMAKGKNAHDDAQDVLTGIVEKLNNKFFAV
jgi:predicted phage terminase large subunit-like protein